MDKLIWYDSDGRINCRRGYEVALVRLASYEATGMMPDEIVKMAERLAAYEDMDKMRIRPGDTLWLSKMFYTHPKKPMPVAVDAIRIDRDGVMFITGRKRFSEDAIGRTVFLTESEAEKALAEMEGKKDG